MPKPMTIAIVALLSGLAGGGVVAAYYEWRSKQDRTEEVLISLSNHSTILSALGSGDTRMALRFLTVLADADVMRLMDAREDSQRVSDFGRKALLSYGDFRRENPQLYGVPEYVDSSGRAEYEENLKNIQRFLDQAQPARR